MEARKGRASFMGARSVGHEDPARRRQSQTRSSSGSRENCTPRKVPTGERAWPRARATARSLGPIRGRPGDRHTHSLGGAAAKRDRVGHRHPANIIRIRLDRARRGSRSSSDYPNRPALPAIRIREWLSECPRGQPRSGVAAILAAPHRATRSGFATRIASREPRTSRRFRAASSLGTHGSSSDRRRRPRARVGSRVRWPVTRSVSHRRGSGRGSLRSGNSRCACSRTSRRLESPAPVTPDPRP
jgi:hypothetical protein